MPTTSPLSILLLDADLAALHIIARALRQHSHAVTAVSDPVEALALLDRNAALDVFVLDLDTLPGQGLEIIARIAARPAGLYLVALSSRSHAEGCRTLETAASLGAALTFRKPFLTEELIHALQALPPRHSR